jgi:adenylate cyclase
MSAKNSPKRLLRIEAVRGTVLFADIRGYTALAERLNPVAVVSLLEEFFAVLAGAVERQGGAIVHLAGDSLMAGFGLGDPADEPTRAAVRAGRTMVESILLLSAQWERRHAVVAGIGVGVHVGAIVDTQLGPPSFRRRTLIGDTVNVAARLCERARAGEVLFSAAVIETFETPHVEEFIALPDLTLRGRKAPVRIFCVPVPARLNLESPPRRRVSAAAHIVA